MRNPYYNFYHWVKGEIFDVEALVKAIEYKEKTLKIIQQKEKTKKNTQETLDNVTTGRKTVKTIFKSIDDTGKMVNKIESVSTLSATNCLCRPIRISSLCKCCMTYSPFIWARLSFLSSKKRDKIGTRKS